MKFSIEERGQSLVEIIIVMAMSIVILPALLTGLISSRQGKAQQAQRTQALYLLNETVDAVRSVREKNWASFAVNGTYHTATASASWILVPGPAVSAGFTQQIIIGDINRDSGGSIASMGGTLDPSSKKVDISISWGQPYASTISANLLLTRYLDNNSFTQTTAADFNVGTKSGTTVTNTAGGEVVLGAGGQGDWCSPNLSLPSLDLPKSGVANALTAIEGKAFAGTGENASGVSFANIIVSNNSPPNLSIAGTFDGYKTNGVFGETNYAYITTDNNSKELVIIDLTQQVGGKYVESGYFDAPKSGESTGRGIFVLGDTGYAGIASKLYAINLSSKVGSRPQFGNLSLGEAVIKIVVVGSYAYVVLSGDGDPQMKIINVSDPASMSVVGQATLDGEEARDLYVNSTGTRAYIVTEASSSKREVFIVDTSAKTGSRPTIGSYDTNGMSPKGVTVVTGNKAIIVGTGAEEYQVIDISQESIPARCGGLNVDTGINGVSSVLEQDGDAYSYIITGDASSEFKVIAGGPGGQYSSSGTFISGPFDAGYQTAFNRFDVSVNRPDASDIQFQVAVAPAVGGNCSAANFNFVGPGATSSAFFTTNVTSGIQSFNFSVPTALNPGRCFKYKAFFSTTDSLSTSILYDMTGNYSP